FDNPILQYITPEMAKKVKFLRCKENKQWKEIAMEIQRLYPKISISSDLLIAGAFLCEGAKYLLQENREHGWF
ncbi:unnamed protein product, partial [marine sediment metagenome]